MYSKEESLFLNKLGEKLKKLRLEKDLSQEALAFNAGLDRTYYSSVERGERNISILNLRKIANALDITVGEITNGIK
jgi:transcriptional regulator with XRE-family HTH domain